MKGFKRVLTLVLMGAIVSVTGLTQMSAFGQRGNDNRPPKEREKIKEKDKPPPSNSNSQGNNNRRGKP